MSVFPSATTKQVNKAGDRIRKAAERREAPREDDLALLDEFRAWHYPTLRHVQDRLSRLLHRKLGLGPEALFPVTARPLKTRQAIVAKLVREKTRLATMQDIAGTRVVVPGLERQEAVVAAILREFKRCEPVVSKLSGGGRQVGLPGHARRRVHGRALRRDPSPNADARVLGADR